MSGNNININVKNEDYNKFGNNQLIDQDLEHLAINENSFINIINFLLLLYYYMNKLSFNSKSQFNLNKVDNINYQTNN